MVLDNTRLAGKPDEYEAAVRSLTLRLRGQLVRPGEDDYDTTRAVWNGAVDRYPALIVRAADVTDVINAVNFARAYDLTVAVRSGGHSLPGYGTVDDGLMIDLSGMKGIDVDPVRRTARVEPAVTSGELNAQTQEYGLTIPTGDVASVGIGGLTLGGGIGWLVRKYGLAIDHLLSADVVTADGRLVTASADENPDLFWAIRGGGGNFGIITSFEFRLVPAGMILGGAIFYGASEAKEVLLRQAEYVAAAPDELTTITAVMQAPPLPFIPPEHQGQLVVAILVVYAGDLTEGERVVAPLRTLGTPIADVVGPMPYPAIYKLTENGSVKGLHHDIRSMYLRELNEEVVETILAYAGAMASPFSMAQIRMLGGAMGRVAEDATAFAHRDAPIMFSALTSWPDSAAAAPNRAWTEQFFRAMRPHASGVYVNFLVDEGEERIREAYKPDTYERLVEVKNRYDPTNFFRLNQNIKPRV